MVNAMEGTRRPGRPGRPRGGPDGPDEMRLTSPGVPRSLRSSGTFKDWSKDWSKNWGGRKDGKPEASNGRGPRATIKAVELLEDRSGVGYRTVAFVEA
jgi:hypothetical protein